MKKQFLWWCLVSLAVFGFLFGCQKAKLDQYPVTELNLSEIQDGVYYGEYTLNPEAVAANRTAKVEVTVANGKITDIKLIESFDIPAIRETVIEKQSLKFDVDAISGGTYSKVVILKAIENALNKEVEKE
jgi:uncharacterized protein with FMN-binding domain